MAKGGETDIPGNDPGQEITSSSTYTHVQGTPDGTRGSNVGTLKCAGTGDLLPWVIAGDVSFTSLSHGSNSGARGGPYSMNIGGGC